MIIQKMNNVLVKHGKVTFAIFTGIVIVSFVWFFTPGVDGSLLLGGNIGMGSQYGAVLGEFIETFLQCELRFLGSEQEKSTGKKTEREKNFEHGRSSENNSK